MVKNKIKLKHLLAPRVEPLNEIEAIKGQWFLSHLYKWDAALTNKRRRIMNHINALKTNAKSEAKIQNNNYWLGLIRKHENLDKQSDIILQQIEKLIQVLAQGFSQKKSITPSAYRWFFCNNKKREMSLSIHILLFTIHHSLAYVSQ